MFIKYNRSPWNTIWTDSFSSSSFFFFNFCLYFEHGQTYKMAKCRYAVYHLILGSRFAFYHTNSNVAASNRKVCSGWGRANRWNWSGSLGQSFQIKWYYFGWWIRNRHWTFNGICLCLRVSVCLLVWRVCSKICNIYLYRL